MASHIPTSQSTRSHAIIRRLHTQPLHLLVVFLLSDAVLRRSGALLLELFTKRAVNLFFEDGLGLDGLELGLEVLHVVGGRIASTAGVGHIGSDIFDLVTSGAPIALAAATLLCLGRVRVGMAGLSEVFGKSRLTLGSAISNAGVVAISELVRASHV